MPDFDTRRPSEPDRSSRSHLFLVAGRQHIRAVASRLRRSVRQLLRNSSRISRLGLALTTLLVVVIAGGIMSWAAETPAEQLDQEIQLKPPPAFSTENNSD